MIPWDGEEMHDGKPDETRCVNCDDPAEDNGWCRPCWETIVPPMPDRGIVVGDGEVPS